ncbi:RagB/SusD family nutrient uptake outer membrane protein [Dysgonomonas reticulitermitis]
MKKYIAIVALCCGFASCTDILDTAPYDQVATSTMWTTENLTDMGMNGVYANLRNWGIYGTSLNTASDQNSNGMGQWAYEILGPLGESHNVADFLSGSLNPRSGNVNNLWKRLYEGIHRANDAITNIPALSPCSEEKKACLVAEARFLRAFHYYRLNELWHGVPYYDVPIRVEECIKGQETEEFIWGKILEDLTACINEPNLPNIDIKGGRVTKGAAYALRGKVYMQQKKWPEAAADFDKVGQCGYKLFMGDYKALFTAANERCEEMIFSVQNVATSGYGSISQKYLGTRSAQGSCWGDHQITPYAVELYENADGTPFNWDDYLPGYSSLSRAEREVYFLRDTLKNGSQIITVYNKNETTGVTTVSYPVSAVVRARLATMPSHIASLYLPEGNEARIRTAYDNRDPRLEKNVITPYSQFRGTGLNSTEFTYTYRWPYCANATLQGNVQPVAIGDFQPDYTPNYLYHQRKFVYEGYNPAFVREYGDIDDPLIRYADVLLMWAEALIEQNDLSGAMAKVKQVRDRVGITTLSANFADQDKARKYVRDERRREMLGEGGAYFDELRWGTLKESKYTAPTGDVAQHKQIWGILGRGANFRWPDVYSGNKMIWPIPGGEIEMNPNLQHTPGWTY